ncbi:M50 family metallopeptidase [Leptolyngbya ohadii]|uniref:M50 family metallopeptidase n=1 Tax=Leptolyngbya ohadii TaxID=1962290 RepID=UPI000B59FEA5|nr:M50 family metallopeptidase [Leptolyngbya ohadii]
MAKSSPTDGAKPDRSKLDRSKPGRAELNRAKAGDAEAIAGLLNQVLGAQGMTVRGDRQQDCLILRLSSPTSPDRTKVINTIQQGMKRLNSPAIRQLQIHCEESSGKTWRESISLFDAISSHPQSEPEHQNSPPTTQSSSSVGELGDSASAIPTGLESSSNPIDRLEATYRALRSDPSVSLESIDQAYFRLKTELLRQGNRSTATALKVDHTQFKEKRIQENQQIDPSSSPDEEIDEHTQAIALLVELLRSNGLEGQARVQNQQLQIRIDPGSVQSSRRVTAIVYTLLEQQPEIWKATNVSEVMVYGMASPRKIAWKSPVPLPRQQTIDDTDLMSFKNPYVSAIAFPLLMGVGIIMNVIPFVDFLLRGIKIWFHEFGHATIAWLSGRRAIPLPFGWTSVDLDRSLFVYLGLLVLFSLLFWAGRRENQRWTMALAAGLMVVQFVFTWLLPEHRFFTLLSFGGIGGELYLCTLLMVGFFFPLPAYWRWDFYRFPVAIGAAFTFWGQFWLWQQIKAGWEEIPWGSMWGGPDDGDMNSLSNAGWSDQQIIGTYSTLGNFCLIALLSAYFYFAIRQNRHYLFALTQRWLAR